MCLCNTLTPLSVEGLDDGRYTGAPDMIILLLEQSKTQAEPLSSPIPRGRLVFLVALQYDGPEKLEMSIGCDR